MTLTSELRAVGRVLRERAGAILAFALAFQALNFILLAPLAAATLRLFLNRWGRASVGNFEIATFFLSPIGLAAVVGVGGVTLAVVYLEIAGLLRLMADRRLDWWRGLTGPVGMLPRLLLLGVIQVVAFLALALPFLAGIGLVYKGLWYGRDIYSLLALKPPIFWGGVAIAAVLLAIYGVLAIRLLLRWLLAVPALLFEPGTTPIGALRLSADRTRGRLTTLAATLLAWAVLDVLFNTLVLGLLGEGSDAILERIGSKLAVALPVTAALLVLHGLVVGALGILGTVSFAAVVRALDRWIVGPRGLTAEADPSPSPAPFGLSRTWAILGALALVAGLTIATAIASLRKLSLSDRVEITAHRAGAAFAPENSVAALKRAIADRADWAEIDVQRTSDDAIVVTHDTDLARIGGGNRTVRRSTLAEIRALDIGVLFSPEFAGERVPTLNEFLRAASDQIRLNIELKLSGPDDVTALTERVVAEVQRAGMADRCRVCSQSYPAIQLARKLEPRIQIGFIAGAAIGDLAGLDVDFLMVRTELVTRRLVDRAARQGIAVHAWTVKDPTLVPGLLDRGVVNIITDDAPAIRAALQELRGLSPVDRLLLRARNELID